MVFTCLLVAVFDDIEVDKIMQLYFRYAYLGSNRILII